MNRAIYSLPFILLILIVTACATGKKPATYTGDTGSIIAQAEWPGDVKSDLVTVRMTVSGPDMDTVSQDFSFTGRSGEIHGIHGVPAGGGRTIIIEGLSSDNTKLYKGTVADIDVIPGQVMYGGFIAMEAVRDMPTLTQPVIRAMSEDEKVTIEWDGIAGADSYSIYMSMSPGASKRSFDARKSTGSNSYTWSGLRNGATYYFIVTAQNSSAESSESNEVNAIPNIPLREPAMTRGTAAPANIGTATGDEEVTIQWDRVSGADSYSIYMSMSPGASKRSFDARKSTGSNSYTWSGLRNGRTYYFIVTAENSSGESSASSEVNATPGVRTRARTVKPKTLDKPVSVPVPESVPQPAPTPKKTPAPSVTKLSPEELLGKADQIRAPGKSFVQDVKITFKKGEKEIVNKMSIRVKNFSKSLVIYKYPPAQNGRVILMVENNMWIYFPGTKKAIRISPAQQLLGQVSNADVSRVVYRLDYKAESVEEDNTGNEKLLKMFLKAKTKAAAYGSINLWLKKDNFHLVKAEFFTISGRLLKTIYYKGYKHVLGKERPTIYEIHDSIKKSEITIMEYTGMKVEDTPDSHFQKTFMHRVSRLNP